MGGGGARGEEGRVHPVLPLGKGMSWSCLGGGVGEGGYNYQVTLRPQPSVPPARSGPMRERERVTLYPSPPSRIVLVWHGKGGACSVFARNVVLQNAYDASTLFLRL